MIANEDGFGGLHAAPVKRPSKDLRFRLPGALGLRDEHDIERVGEPQRDQLGALPLRALQGGSYRHATQHTASISTDQKHLT